MKKMYIVALAFGLMSLPLAAQDTYLNEQTSSTTDLNGSARFVAMGGALGALGADVSASSANPAALGLFRRTTAVGTMGFLTQPDMSVAGASRTHFSFDNLGIVISLPVNTGGSGRFFNFGVNYQKKANYNRAFTAANRNTGGLSQTDVMAELCNSWASTDAQGNTTFPSRLIGTAYRAWLFDADEQGYYGYGAQKNAMTRIESGSLQGFDINLSFNLDDRYYLGLTLGVDNMDYACDTEYSEVNLRDDGAGGLRDEGYDIYTHKSIDGYGVNVKLGGIVRPFEESAFRVGLAIESPTFYRLQSSTTYTIASPFTGENCEYTPGRMNYYEGEWDNYFDYELRTPWKFRFSLGHTIDRYLALGAEYEYADYSRTKFGYPTYDEYWGEYEDCEDDRAMNRLTERTLQGVHSLKLGAELRVTNAMSLRLGYNYYSKAYKKDARLNQNIDSYAMGMATETDYMNTGDVNILTCGLGFQGKHWFFDAAYKYRMQTGTHYAFDDSFTSDASFATQNPDLAGTKLKGTEVNLDRHQAYFSVGYRF